MCAGFCDSFITPSVIPFRSQDSEFAVMKKVNQELLQQKMITNLTMLDPNQLPDSPSHLFACKNDPKSEESVVLRSTLATGNSSLACTSDAAGGRNTSALSQSQVKDCSLAALATGNKQPAFNGSVCTLSTNQQFTNPEHTSVNRRTANSFLQSNLQVNGC